MFRYFPVFANEGRSLYLPRLDLLALVCAVVFAVFSLVVGSGGVDFRKCLAFHYYRRGRGLAALLPPFQVCLAKFMSFESSADWGLALPLCSSYSCLMSKIASNILLDLFSRFRSALRTAPPSAQHTPPCSSRSSVSVVAAKPLAATPSSESTVLPTTVTCLAPVSEALQAIDRQGGTFVC